MKISETTKAGRILKKHLIQGVTKHQLEFIFAAMEEYAKEVHKGTRHELAEKVDELSNETIFENVVMNHNFNSLVKKLDDEIA